MIYFFRSLVIASPMIKSSSIASVLNRHKFLVFIPFVSLQLGIGVLYSYPLFISVFTKEYNWTTRAAEAVWSCVLVMLGIASLVSSNFIKYSYRFLSTVSAFLLFAAYQLASRFTGSDRFDFWYIFLGVGVLNGSAIGFTYVVGISVPVTYFPKHKGLITGLAVGIYGTGSLAWTYMSQAFLDHNYSLSTIFKTFSYLSAPIVLIAGWFMVPAPINHEANDQTSLINKVEENEIVVNTEGKPIKITTMSLGETLSNKHYWLTFLSLVIGACAGFTALGALRIYPAHALAKNGYSEEEIQRATFLATGLFFHIGNGCGRIFFGLLTDYIGVGASYLLIFALQTINFTGFIWFAGHPLSLYFSTIFIACFYGSTYVVVPLMVDGLFGHFNFSSVFPRILIATSFAGIIGPNIFAFFEDRGKPELTFAVIGGALFIATGISLYLRRAVKSRK
ncbi:hypothetical protein RCL1_006987 [Eukaryota sp. TZLM3-RCL]